MVKNTFLRVKSLFHAKISNLLICVSSTRNIEKIRVEDQQTFHDNFWVLKDYHKQNILMGRLVKFDDKTFVVHTDKII